ncbi:enoyl-CoA hydratase-related protein [Pseudonocardia halophobica]|uniref:enoyl-CoA hydratase-related protein n=1 Tax=Pseudonocardia halophobica TaxID=29401 RepID=UPI003D8B4BC8
MGEPMELKVTRVEVDEHGVATVTLNRPERGNSWTARMHAEYRWIMAELEADPRVRVAVLTGAGRAFCVGADSKALSGYVKSDNGFDPGLPREAANPGYGVRPEFDADVSWQLGLRFPLIAAVNGACAGVALALAAYADIRFGMWDAKITTATPKLAMPAEYGLSWILPRLLGATHAADVLLSGRILRAQEIGAMGFFNKVLGPEEFGPAVTDYARLLAGLSPAATTATKRQLYDDLLDADPARSVNRSKELIGELMAHPDYAEGVRALVEKRAPRFGR